MKKQNIDTNNKENQIKEEIKRQESKSLMQSDFNEALLYKNKINEFIIGEKDIVGFIKIVEDMVSSSNLQSEVKSVSTESNDVLNVINAEYIRVKIDVIGEWKNINFFLKLLENYPLIIKIDNVFLTKFSDYEIKDKKFPQWLGSFDFTVVKIKDSE